MKKTSLVVLVACIAVGVSAGFTIYQLDQQSALQEQQLGSYQRQVDNLLNRIEENSRDRLNQEQQILDLQARFDRLQGQYTNTTEQLESARQQANPDYQQMEAEIRQQLSRQLNSQASPANPSRLQLIRQLSALDQREIGELMSLQGAYGPFLQNLQVDDQRLEVIVDSLSNMVAAQNEARMELISELRQVDVNPEELRDRMMEIGSKENQLEALSLVLTDEELALFEDYQDSLPEPRRPAIRAAVSRGDGGQDNTVFFSSGDASAVLPPDAFLLNNGGNGTTHAISIEVLETPLD